RRRLLVFFAYTLSFSTLFGGLALYLERRYGFDVEKTGYVFGLSGFVGALIQGGLIGRLVKKLGEARLSLYGFLALGVGAGLLRFGETENRSRLGAVWATRERPEPCSSREVQSARVVQAAVGRPRAESRAAVSDRAARAVHRRGTVPRRPDLEAPTLEAAPQV